MVNDIKQFELRKSGKTQFNQPWGYGTLTTELFNYTGIVTFKEDYKVTDGCIYEVTSIDLRINKKGNLIFTIALK